MRENAKSQMGMKRSKKALPDVIPPRICRTFQRATFWFRAEKLENPNLERPGRKHDKISKMDTKGSKKALPEVIPPRICITFRRASFFVPTKTLENVDLEAPVRKHNKCQHFLADQAENTTNTEPERHVNFSKNVKTHNHRSKQDPYLTLRAENQAF